MLIFNTFAFGQDYKVVESQILRRSSSGGSRRSSSGQMGREEHSYTFHFPRVWTGSLSIDRMASFARLRPPARRQGGTAGSGRSLLTRAQVGRATRRWHTGRRTHEFLGIRIGERRRRRRRRRRRVTSRAGSCSLAVEPSPECGVLTQKRRRGRKAEERGRGCRGRRHGTGSPSRSRGREIPESLVDGVSGLCFLGRVLCFPVFFRMLLLLGPMCLLCSVRFVRVRARVRVRVRVLC